MMLGSRSGWVKKVKELAPEAKGIHCFIQRCALACKTFPTALQKVLNLVIRNVNFIKARSRTSSTNFART